MTINTQKLRDLLTVLKDDECEGEAQYAAAQQIVAAAAGLLDHIEAQAAEIAEAESQADRYRRASERWKKVAESAEERARDQAAETARLRDALDGAATSLNTIATLAGSKDDYLEDVFQVRGYAHSRARVARAALSGESKC